MSRLAVFPQPLLKLHGDAIAPGGEPVAGNIRQPVGENTRQTRALKIAAIASAYLSRISSSSVPFPLFRPGAPKRPYNLRASWRTQGQDSWRNRESPSTYSPLRAERLIAEWRSGRRIHTLFPSDFDQLPAGGGPELCGHLPSSSTATSASLVCPKSA